MAAGMTPGSESIYWQIAMALTSEGMVIQRHVYLRGYSGLYKAPKGAVKYQKEIRIKTHNSETFGQSW